MLTPQFLTTGLGVVTKRRSFSFLKSSKRKTAKGVPAQICGNQARKLLQWKPLPLQSFPRYIWLKKELKNKNFCILTTFDVSLLSKKLELVLMCDHDWKQVLGSQPTKYEIDIEMLKPVYACSVFGPMIP